MTRFLADCNCPRVVHTHGSVRMATHHGCLCQPCLDAVSNYRSETRKLRRRREGRWVDAGPPRAKLLELRAAGATSAQIKALTGMSRSTQTILANGYPGGGEQTRLRADLARKLNAVTPEALAAAQRKMGPNTKVPGDASRLQIQALLSLGWSVSYVSLASRVPLQTLYRIMRGHGTTERYQRRIRGVYMRLRESPAPMTTARQRAVSERARAQARSNGWSVQATEEELAA